MKKSKQLLAFVLVLVLLLSLTPTAAQASEDETANAPVDYVLVVDTSGSTSYTDEEKICEEAVRVFTNMIPLDNARVAVVAFGNNDRMSAYRFTSRYSDDVSYATKDKALVHLLVDLQGTPDLASKTQITEMVDQLSELASDADLEDEASKTPLGLATMAALDLLEANDAVDGRACIVLMTDGRITSHDNYITDGELLYDVLSKNKDSNAAIGKAVSVAASHDWPIYSIELNDDGENTEGGNVRTRLKKIAEKTGATYDANNDGTISQEENGSQVVNDIDDVIQALLRVIARFSDGSTSYIQPNEDGIAVYPFEIQDMISEKTMIVHSEKLYKVELLNEAGDVVYTFDQTCEQEDMVVIRDDNHLCIKLVCPDAGKFTLKAYGEYYAGISVYEDSTAGMTLELHSTKEIDGVTLPMNQVIPFEAYFTYKDIPFRDNPYYTTSAPAMLEVYDTTTGELVVNQAMQASRTGYSYQLAMSELSESSFSARVVLVDAHFNNERKVSSSVIFYTEEQDTTVLPDIVEVPSISLKVGETFRLHMSDYFLNPDGTPVTYVLEGKGASGFQTQVDGDLMEITAPMCPDVYELNLVAQDQNMMTNPQVPWVVTVKDDPIEAPQTVKLVTEAPDMLIQLAKIEETTEVNLGDIFSNPDGYPVEFIECVIDDEDILSCSTRSGDWIISAVSSGKTVMTVTMSDGVVDEFGQPVETTREVRVEVLSPLGVLIDHFKALLLTLFALLVLVIIWLVIRAAKTSFKDCLRVKVRTQNGRQYECDYPVDLSQYRKKVKLSTLIEDDIKPYLPVLNGGGQDAAAIRSVFEVCEESGVFENIEIHAIPRSTGYKVVKCKPMSSCTISNNDSNIRKSATITSGELQVVFHENESMLEIVMEIKDDEDIY